MFDDEEEGEDDEDEEEGGESKETIEGVGSAAEGWGALQAKLSQGWKCACCLAQNKQSA